MLQSVHEHPHLAGKQTVQQQQTGHLRLAVKDGSGGTELATDGQQHERLIEDQLQKQRHPERGQGHRADGEKADAVVQQLIFLFCRVDAQRNADNDGQNKGQQNQFHSGRHILRQLRCYRLFCIVVGTQVAMEQILQIVHILDGKGIVEAQFFCGGSQLLRCGPGARPFGGRVGGQHAGHEECKRHHAQKDQDTAEQSLYDIFRHSKVTPGRFSFCTD